MCVFFYYSTKDINKTNCRSYFSAVGAADFSVASSVLNKESLLFSEAQMCLVRLLFTMNILNIDMSLNHFKYV